MLLFTNFRAFGKALLLSVLFLSGQCFAFHNVVGGGINGLVAAASTTIHHAQKGKGKPAASRSPIPKLVSEAAKELARAAIFETTWSRSADHKLDKMNDNFNQKINQMNQKLDNINREQDSEYRVCH
jgi:hypothetical protein